MLLKPLKAYGIKPSRWFRFHDSFPLTASRFVSWELSLVKLATFLHCVLEKMGEGGNHHLVSFPGDNVMERQHKRCYVVHF